MLVCIIKYNFATSCLVFWKFQLKLVLMHGDDHLEQDCEVFRFVVHPELCKVKKKDLDVTKVCGIRTKLRLNQWRNLLAFNGMVLEFIQYMTIAIRIQ